MNVVGGCDFLFVQWSLFLLSLVCNSDNDPQRVQDDSTRDLFDRSCTSWFGAVMTLSDKLMINSYTNFSRCPPGNSHDVVCEGDINVTKENGHLQILETEQVFVESFCMILMTQVRSSQIGGNRNGIPFDSVRFDWGNLASRSSDKIHQDPISQVQANHHHCMYKDE